MHYTINVSKDGTHFFATAEHSCTSQLKLYEVYKAIKSKFPEPEYKVEVTEWRKSGKTVLMGDVA